MVIVDDRCIQLLNRTAIDQEFRRYQGFRPAKQKFDLGAADQNPMHRRYNQWGGIADHPGLKAYRSRSFVGWHARRADPADRLEPVVKRVHKFATAQVFDRNRTFDRFDPGSASKADNVEIDVLKVVKGGRADGRAILFTACRAVRTRWIDLSVDRVNVTS